MKRNFGRHLTVRQKNLIDKFIKDNFNNIRKGEYYPIDVKYPEFVDVLNNIHVYENLPTDVERYIEDKLSKITRVGLGNPYLDMADRMKEDIEKYATEDEKKILTKQLTEAKNEKGKTRKVDNPYEIYNQGDWEWRVLKHYQTADKEKTNPYARVFCAVKSPYTHNRWEYGDTYCNEIPGYKYEGGPTTKISELKPKTAKQIKLIQALGPETLDDEIVGEILDMTEEEIDAHLTELGI